MTFSECNDSCVDMLLNEIDGFKNSTISIDFNENFPLPWNRINAAKNSSDQLQVERI